MKNIESAAATGIPILTLRRRGAGGKIPDVLDNLPTNDNERDLL